MVFIIFIFLISDPQLLYMLCSRLDFNLYFRRLLVLDFYFFIDLFTLNYLLTKRPIVAMMHFFLLEYFVQITLVEASLFGNGELGDSFLDELIDGLAL